MKILDTLFTARRMYAIWSFGFALLSIIVILSLMFLSTKDIIHTNPISIRSGPASKTIVLNEDLEFSQMQLSLRYLETEATNITTTVILPDNTTISSTEYLKELSFNSSSGYWFNHIDLGEPRIFEKGDYIFNFEVDNPKTTFKDVEIRFKKVKVKK